MSDLDTLYGMTVFFNDINRLKEEYKRRNLHVKCVHCGEDIIDNCYSLEGVKEVVISGFCEKCFDELFKDDENEEDNG